MSGKKAQRKEPDSMELLRQQAEERLRTLAKTQPHLQPPTDWDIVAQEDPRRLLHELLVHQVELEMQNEEMHRTEMELEASRARYFDLYDLAPVGYLTLSEGGEILKSNLTASELLGVERSRLAQQSFPSFTLREDVDSFHLFCKRLFATGDPQVCELRLLKKGAAPFWARLQATLAEEKESSMPVCRVVVSDISEHRRAEEWNDAERELLRLCNAASSVKELMRSLVLYFKHLTGCEAVGVRLHEGDDFPYYETQGLPEEFIQAETRLCAVDQQGELLRDSTGNPVLECMCGNILCGRFDPGKSFFTKHGSFWSSCTTELLASTSEADRQGRTRNRCNGEGYESVALLPLRTGQKIFGLFQFNDHRRGCFNLERIEILEHLVDYVATALAKLKTEEELRASEERYHTVADFTADWETWIDPEGNYLYISPSCERITGYRADEFMHNPALLESITYPEDRQAVADHFYGERHNDSLLSLEFRIRTKDGEERWIEHACLPVKRADGTHLGRRGSSRDITERKRAEEQLYFQSSLVDNASDAIIALGSDGVIKSWNAVAELMYGWSAQEVVGHPLREFIRDDYGTITEEYTDQQLAESGVWKGDLYQYRRDGVKFPVQAAVSVVKDNQGKLVGYVAINRDITERKRVEDALKQSEEKFRLLTEKSVTGVFIIQDAKMAYVNPSFARTFGYSPEEIIGTLSPDDLIHPDDLQVAMRSLQGRQEGQIAKGNINYKAIKKDGSAIVIEIYSMMIDYQGRPAVMGTLMDITERKLAEQLLHTSEERFRTLSAASPACIYLTDAKGKCQYVNQRWCEMTGLTFDEALGDGWVKGLHPEDRQKIADAWEQMTASKGQWGLRYRFQNKEGKITWVDGRASPLYDPQGTISGYVGVNLDINDRVQADAKNEILLAELHQQSREREAIIQLSSALRKVQTMQDAQTIMAEQSLEVLKAGAAALVLLEGQSLHVAAGVGQWRAVTGMSHIPRSDLFFDALKNGQPHYIAGQKEAAADRSDSPFLKKLMTHLKSAAWVPLKAGESTIGMLLVGYPEAQQFDAEHTTLLLTIAEIAGNTLQRMRTMESLEHMVTNRTSELAVLYRVVSIASQSLNLKEMLELALEQVLQVMDCTLGHFALFDETRHALNLVISSGMPPGFTDKLISMPLDETMQGWILKDGHPLLIADLSSDPRSLLPDNTSGDTYAYLGVPMRSRGQVIGVLSIDRTGGSFDVDEITLLGAIADHIGLIVENARLHGRASQAAVLEERSRLARDLHDSVTQSLYSATLYAEASRSLAEPFASADLNHHIGRFAQITQQALKEMRLLIYELLPLALEQDGLIAALQKRLDMVENRSGVHAHFVVNQIVSLDARTEIDLYRVALEALNNVLKHARASEITLNLEFSPDQVLLSIQDNGRGFDASVSGILAVHGLGLRSMQERVNIMGGTLTISSNQGMGTTITAQIPIRMGSDKPAGEKPPLQEEAV